MESRGCEVTWGHVECEVTWGPMGPIECEATSLHLSWHVERFFLEMKGNKQRFGLIM